MALLPRNGHVLVAGGMQCAVVCVPPAAAETYDPAGTWAVTAPMPRPRFSYLGVTLSSGTALLAGGISPLNGSNSNVRSAELYHP